MTGPGPPFQPAAAREEEAPRVEAAAHVVVVDDDEGVRRGLARLLVAGGYRARTFESAEAFLADPEREAADCLVLDVHLGGMSGFELHSRLVEQGEAPPVVFVTAHANPEYRAHAVESGSQCLGKPVDARALFEAIGRALGRSPAGSSPS